MRWSTAFNGAFLLDTLTVLPRNRLENGDVDRGRLSDLELENRRVRIDVDGYWRSCIKECDQLRALIEGARRQMTRLKVRQRSADEALIEPTEPPIEPALCEAFGDDAQTCTKRNVGD